MSESKLLHGGRHLLYSTELAAKIGRNEAICLQQVYYWMGIGGGKVIDGIKWFWKTYEQWSEEMQVSVSTVRRVIANLKNLDLISVDKLSAKTYYQANWYTLNKDALDVLIQNEQIDAIGENTSICSELTDHIKDYSTKTNSTQQQAAVVEKVFVEPDWDELQKKSAEWEATQLGIETEPTKSTDYIDNLKDNYINYTTNTENPHEGRSPAPNEINNQSQNDSIVTFAGVNFKTIDTIPEGTRVRITQPTVYSSDAIEGEEAIDSIKPSVTTDEMRDITNQLRVIPCTPAFRVNPQVQACIRKNWGNAAGALAFIKEQIAANAKPKKSWEAWFVFALTEGLKPEKGVAPSNFRTWFDEAYRRGLVIASELRSDGVTGVCLAEKVANSLGVGEWVRFEKAVELLQQVLSLN